jgi:hypothetical protein
MHAVLRVLHLFGRRRRTAFDEGAYAFERESDKIAALENAARLAQPETFLPDTMCTDEIANERRSNDDRGDP